jgi:myxalamid-type polyketide synthase MxaB
LSDICFTANTGRSHFNHRFCILSASVAQLREQIDAYLTGKEVASVVSGQVKSSQSPKIAFLFTGQGSQYAGMGKELYETQPTFRAVLDSCAEILKPYLDIPLLEILYPKSENSPPLPLSPSPPLSLIDETIYTQPILFSLEYALYQLWKSWGIEPSAVMGHSVGEYVAACVAGVFSLEDGLKLIAARGRLMQQLPHDGTMVAVFASEEKVSDVIKPYQKQVALAAINGAENLVISGKREAIEEIIANLQGQGIQTKQLNVSHAFHSPLMEPILTEFEQIAGQIIYSLPQIDLISNLTGKIINEEIATPQYWVKHIRQPVQFAQSIKTLHQLGYQSFVEIGAKPTLLGMGRAILDNSDFCLWLPSLRPGYSNWEQLLGSLAQLYAQGITINWFGFDRDYSRRRVALPTYPFQRKRYWIEANLQFKIYNPVHPLLGQKLRSPLKEIIFESQLAPNTPAFLKDHRIFQQTVLPGTAYLEMALASGAEVFKSNNLMIEDFIVQQALTLPENKTQNVQIILSKESTGTSFQIYSLVSENDSWQLHSSGKIITTEQVTESIDIAQLRGHFANEISVKTHYQQCREQGIDYGLSFRAIAQLWSQNNEALGLIKITEETSQYHFHPALLDACLQVIFAAVPSDLKSETYLPLGLERFCFYRHPKQTLWSHVRLRPFNKLTPEIIVADVSIFDENGNLIARIEGISSKRASRQNLLGGGREKSWHDWLYQIEWQIQSKSQTSDFYPTSDSWLFLVDEGKFVEQLSAFLDSQKQRNIFIFSVEVNQKIEYFCEVINIIKNQELSIGNIVYLCNLNNLETTVQRECSNVLDLVQSLVQAELTYSPRLWIVTRGAQAFKNDNSSLLNLTQSCLWGMGKVIALEHPEFNCTCIDLDPKSTENEIQKLCAEIASPDSENQIAFRDGKRYVARLVPYRFQENSEQNAISTQLTIENRGTLDNLRWQPATRRQPNADEVEIQVRATGLNFRDVLNVLGLYPGDPGLLGLECTGEIVATGQGVQDFQIGDAVVAIAPGSFSQYVTVSASLVVPKPHHLSFEEAATIPSAFLTAYYTLHHLSKIKQGDRVLIHAAAGGVGLAAIQIAQQAGAAIFATASPSKWDFLKSWGVQRIMNSRTLDFADEVMSATQGEGVDIVLNSLSGEFIPKSLSVLSSKGRFIEIGKNGAWEPERVAQFAPNLSYFLIDLVEVTQQQPDLINSMLCHVMQQLAAGNLKPLPCQIFKRDRVVDAFRTMQQAQHIGKIVVSQKAGGRRQEAGGRSRDTKFCVFTEIQDDGIYLITGGLGGLGLQIARWLVDKGARHLILVGRSEVSQAARETINQLEQAGARISVVQADISKLDDITRILPLSPSSPHPLIPSPPSQLRGIIHAAGVLDDSVLIEQTWERFERVMEPKIKGAWNLHLATQNYPLDFFVLFSSAASVVGSAGQANYAAANAFLDALAYYRRTMGLTGTSINWGIWSSVGMAAQLTERDRFRLEKQGMSAIAVEQGLQILEKLLACDPVQVCVLPIDWSAFLKQLPNNRILPFFEKVRPALAGKIQPEFLEHLKAATPSDRTLLLIDRIKVYVAKILRIESPETIDIEQGFTELGMDSLSSVELRNQLQTNLQLTLPSTLIFDYPSICAIANYLEQKIFASVSLQKQEKTLDPTLAEIENLSESEAEALLLKELLGDE